MTGVILPSLEMNELQYPARVLKHEYIADFTGPGRWRGAPGLETRIEYLSDSRTNVMMAGVPQSGAGAVRRRRRRAEPRSSWRSDPMTARREVAETAFSMHMPPGGTIHFLARRRWRLGRSLRPSGGRGAGRRAERVRDECGRGNATTESSSPPMAGASTSPRRRRRAPGVESRATDHRTFRRAPRGTCRSMSCCTGNFLQIDGRS